MKYCGPAVNNDELYTRIAEMLNGKLKVQASLAALCRTPTPRFALVRA